MKIFRGNKIYELKQNESNKNVNDPPNMRKSDFVRYVWMNYGKLET